MENVPTEQRIEAIKSFQSTIRKTEKALAQMTEKGAKTTLIERRLKAFAIGLAMLEHAWSRKPVGYTQTEIAEARQVLVDLLPSIQTVYANSKPGSPQRTLLARRLNALELAIRAIVDLDKA